MRTKCIPSSIVTVVYSHILARQCSETKLVYSSSLNENDFLIDELGCVHIHL